LLSGLEWIIVLVIVVAVFIFWGPKKIPEVAKAIAEAKKELEKASKEKDQED